MESSPPPIRRCAIYTRKSTSKGLELDLNSLDVQHDACSQYIASQSSHGWQAIHETYSDGGFTGANLDRPGFQKLLRHISEGKIDIVVVYKVDRLSRSLLDFAHVIRLFQEAHVDFVSTTQHFSTADPMGNLTLNILMSFAQFERQMISERTKDRITTARRKGKWTGGRPPYGYIIQDKKLAQEPTQANIVRRIFTLYQKHPSSIHVVQILNAYCSKPINKFKKAGDERKSSRPWTKHDILRILRHSVYAGYIEGDGQRYEGEHEPIVERALFEKIQGMLTQNRSLSKEGSSITKAQRGRTFLIKGLTFCGNCGAAMTPSSARKGSRKYFYYVCITKQKQGAQACRAAYLPMEETEQFVIRLVSQWIEKVKQDALIWKSLESLMERQRQLFVEAKQKLSSDLTDLFNQSQDIVKTLSKIREPRIIRELQKELAEIETRIEEQEHKVLDVEKTLDKLSERREDLSWAKESLKNFEDVWEHLTPKNRVRIIQLFVKRIDVHESEKSLRVTTADWLSHRAANLPSHSSKTQRLEAQG